MWPDSGEISLEDVFPSLLVGLFGGFPVASNFMATLGCQSDPVSIEDGPEWALLPILLYAIERQRKNTELGGDSL